MQRVVALILVTLVFGACDPGTEISASRRIPNPLDRTCVVEALRMEKTVKEAGVGATGIVYAILTVPESLEIPEPYPDVGVVERSNDKGELEIKLEMVWVGYEGSPEYRAYVQKVLGELLDRTIERCGDN